MKSYLMGKSGPFILFIALMTMSHLVLPVMGRSEWGPFSLWNLFSGFRSQPSFDLLLKRKEREFFLSDGELFDAKYRMNKFLFWYLTQGFSESTPPSSPEGRGLVESLKGVLGENEIQLLSICQIKSTLADHMLMSSNQKRENCDSVYP